MNLFEWSSLRLLYKLVFMGTCVAILISTTVGKIDSQAQAIQSWSDPQNLSNTGFADIPKMVIDSDGVYHVIWQDEFAGIVYVTGDGVNWGVPRAVALPSAETVPLLLADLNGNVHAFWRDDESMLYHSKVRAGDFTSYSAWTSPFLIDSSSLSYDVALDVNGDIHLLYVRPEEELGFPAGIYYRRLRTESNDWFTPSVIYSSYYLRSSGIEDSNVDISTGIIADQVSVYAAWDNPLRGRVFFAKSLDAGQTWDEPQEVDKPNDETGTNSSSNIKVSNVDQNVLIVWQRRDAGDNCSQFYQSSDDYGDTWNIPQKMLEDANGCGIDDQLLPSEDGQIILWTILQNQVNLLAWDQNIWSEAQVQHELSAFEDPDTLNLVVLGCHYPQLLDQELAVVGCDTGDGSDIWFTTRDVSDTSDWYPSPSDWIAPEELITSENQIDSPVLVAGSDELLHVLWSQEANVAGNGAATSIYYMGYDGERWSQPLTVFQSPNGNAIQPSAALDKDERLLVVWGDSQSGDILFSWANAARAGRVNEWVEPIQLPISQTTAVSPKILVDDRGTIIVVFAVPINEGRGIYVTSSTDLGESWSSPIQIFSGVDAGWQIVDQPQLTQTPDGDLHALWVQKALPEIGGTLGLYYAHSEDNGRSWSEAEEVVEGEVNWSQITSDAQGVLYRIWQEVVNNQPIIRYQRSLGIDAGWSLPESLSSFGENLQVAKIVVDQAGQLHLLQIVQDQSGRLVLRHWLWEDGRWVVSENSELAYAPSTEILSMAAAISSDTELNLLYSTIMESRLSDVIQNNLFFTNRKLELPSEIVSAEPTSTTLPVDTPTPFTTSTVQSSITPTIEPTITPNLNPVDSVENGGSSESSISPLMVGGVLAGLIVIAVFVYAIMRVRRA